MRILQRVEEMEEIRLQPKTDKSPSGGVGKTRTNQSRKIKSRGMLRMPVS